MSHEGQKRLNKIASKGVQKSRKNLSDVYKFAIVTNTITIVISVVAILMVLFFFAFRIIMVIFNIFCHIFIIFLDR